MAALREGQLTLAHTRRGSGEPIVLVHGIGSRRQAWDPVIDLIAPEREVIAVDLPGFGDSALDGTTPTAAGFAERLQRFFDEIGVERPHFAGNSLGGGVGFELGRSEAVRSLTAFSPIGFEGGASVAWKRALLRSAFATAKRNRDAGLSGRRVAASRPGSFLVSFGRPFRVPAEELRAGTAALADATGFEGALPGVSEYRLAAPDALGSIPVTIAWGRRDVLHPWWIQSRRARRALPRARHLTLPGCGHVPFHDDPPLCARVLIEGSSGSSAG